MVGLDVPSMPTDPESCVCSVPSGVLSPVPLQASAHTKSLNLAFQERTRPLPSYSDGELQTHRPTQEQIRASSPFSWGSLSS